MSPEIDESKIISTILPIALAIPLKQDEVFRALTGRKLNVQFGSELGLDSLLTLQFILSRIKRI